MLPHRSPEQKSLAMQRLWQLGADQTWRAPYLYFIIDAARDRRIYPKLASLQKRVEIVSLYQGALARDLAEVAPYIFCLGSGESVFDWLWDQGWGRSWGIFLWSRGQDLASLRDHLRRLTMVELEGVGPVTFRFYDPRVLTSFIPTCSRAELAFLFGPVRRFIAETDAGASLTDFRREDDGSLTRTAHTVGSPLGAGR
jgi:hypothetical protein